MTEQANQVDYDQNNNDQLLNTLKRQSRSLSLMTIILFLITVICAWLFFQVDKLGMQLEKANSDINRMISNLDTLNYDTSLMSSNLDTLNYDVSLMSSNLNNLKSQLYSVASDLDHIGALARNANNYAHSHGYSDARLKTVVDTIEQPLERVLQLQGVYYYWNEEAISKMGLDSKQQIGVIAQDVEKVFPELVTVDEHGYKQVDYERLTAVLIEAIKEQQKEIDLLKER